MTATPTSTTVPAAPSAAPMTAPEHVPADLRGYRAAHTAVRSAPRRLAAAARTVDPGDRRAVAALARYWKGYAGEVLAHHTIEDVTVFPALVARAPQAAALIERSDADHHHLDQIMDAAAAAMEGFTRERSIATRERLASCLDALDRHMDEHLGFEDAEILPLIERTFTLGEYRELEEGAYKEMGIGPQAMFAVPFIAAALAPVERDALLKDVPVPFRVLYRTCRGRHARLERRALGTATGDRR